MAWPMMAARLDGGSRIRACRDARIARTRVSRPRRQIALGLRIAERWTTRLQGKITQIVDAGGERRGARWGDEQRIRAAPIHGAVELACIAVEHVVLAAIGGARDEAHIVMPNVVVVGAEAEAGAEKGAYEREAAGLRALASRIAGGRGGNAVGDVIDYDVVVTSNDANLPANAAIVERIDLIVEGGIVRERHVRGVNQMHAAAAVIVADVECDERLMRIAGYLERVHDDAVAVGIIRDCGGAALRHGIVVGDIESHHVVEWRCKGEVHPARGVSGHRPGFPDADARPL